MENYLGKYQFSLDTFLFSDSLENMLSIYVTAKAIFELCVCLIITECKYLRKCIVWIFKTLVNVLIQLIN